MIVRILLVVALGYLAYRTLARWLAPRVGAAPGPKAVEAAEKCPACGAWRVTGAACATPGCDGAPGA